MEDLSQLQSRVDAARERLGGVEADQRKYGLRLDDLVRIVEGALAQQSEELKAARIRSASLQTELDDAQNSVSRMELDLASRETDLARLAGQNEQLRAMVMTLLQVVEGRSATPMREAMVRLERGVRNLITETPSNPAPLPGRRQSDRPSGKAAPEIRDGQRPVLVPHQTIQGRVPTAAPRPKPMPAPFDEGSDALVELTAFGRGNADATVTDPPEASNTAVSSIAQMRRIADDAIANPAATDA